MAEEKIFSVEGEIEINGEKRKFAKKVKAKTVTFAADKTMALFGSKNKIKRNKIIIKEAKEVEANEGKKTS